MNRMGERIKELRKSQNITQEKLAAYLGVSYQAVSKWETGATWPDITLLPRIAHFFGVTADYLLGIKQTGDEEIIQTYYERAMECSHTGDMHRGIALVREALAQYPNNDRLLTVLIDFLFGLFCFNGDTALLQELVTKAELVLQDSITDECRIEVLEKLAYTYNRLEIQEKAIETANRLPDTVCNRQRVLSNIVMPMDKRLEKKQCCVLADFECMIADVLWQGGYALGRKNFPKAREIYRRAVAMLESVGPEGLFLNIAADAYNGWAMACSSLGEVDEAYACLEQVMACHRRFEEVLKRSEVPYSSPVLDVLCFRTEDLHRNFVGSSYAAWVEKLQREYKSYYTAVMADERFAALWQRIQQDLVIYG